MRATLALLMLGACRLGFDDVGSDDVPLSYAPPPAMNLSSHLAIVPVGGTPPFAFRLVAGTGTITADGMFRSPGFPETDQIEITDAIGDAVIATIPIAGQYLYVAGGGNSGVATDEVYRSADGAAWELAGHLPAVRTAGALVVLDDAMYYLGGFDEFDRQSTAWRSTDGATWIAQADLPGPRQSIGATVDAGAITLAGGYAPSGDFTSSYWTSTDGNAWTTATIPTPLHGTVLLAFLDKVWMFGGHDMNGFMDQVSSSADGGATWVAHPPLPLANEYHGTTMFAGRAWLCGGTQLLEQCISTADGETWTDERPLPVQRTEPQLVPWHDELWVVTGGQTQVLHTNGSSWEVAGDYPAIETGARAVQFTPR